MLTTFEEHEESELKTTLAASINRLVKGDEHLLNLRKLKRPEIDQKTLKVRWKGTRSYQPISAFKYWL